MERTESELIYYLKYETTWCKALVTDFITNNVYVIATNTLK